MVYETLSKVVKFMNNTALPSNQDSGTSRSCRAYNQWFRRKPIDGEVKSNMNRSLGVVDLTSLGIAAVIGAGIFSTIGNAASHGGPGVVFLFLFTAVACGFSALCYAQFASHVPLSGSAYTYAYASLGELMAWIIGWDLVMEYAVGNIAVAISWSDYFTSLLSGYGVHVPGFLSMDWLTAHRGFESVQALLGTGVSLAAIAADPMAHGLTGSIVEAYNGYLGAPEVFGFKIIADIPAFLVTALVTWIAFIGIKESKRAANAMVVLKVLVLIVVIAIGAAYVNPANFTPFMPHGFSGVLKGVSGVFFAYIGFDAISTTAEECKNPQRDLPKAMIYSLLICTALYIAVALILTGITPFDRLNVGDPLAYVFGPEGANVPWISAMVAMSAVVALFSVLLVFQVGQPRIWMAMSRDGLLPAKFSKLHPKFRTPTFSTILTGFIVGIPALFMNLTEVTDLTSIGTLSAFLIVSIGALKPPTRLQPNGFLIPKYSSRWAAPILSLVTVIGLILHNPEAWNEFFHYGSWDVFRHRVPLFFYLAGMIYLNYLCIRKNLSLIPVLSISTVGFLMTELGWINWARFGIWLLIGIVVYFLYGMQHSKLRQNQ